LNYRPYKQKAGLPNGNPAVKMTRGFPSQPLSRFGFFNLSFSIYHFIAIFIPKPCLKTIKRQDGLLTGGITVDKYYS